MLVRTCVKGQKTISVLAPDLCKGGLLEIMLGVEGHDTHAFTFAPEVVDDLAEECPDLIVVAPGRNDGTKALRLVSTLRTLPETRSIPVILLDSTDRLATSADASGNVYAVLPMTFRMATLLNTVQCALAERAIA